MAFNFDIEAPRPDDDGIAFKQALMPTVNKLRENRAWMQEDPQDVVYGRLGSIVKLKPYLQEHDEDRQEASRKLVAYATKIIHEHDVELCAWTITVHTMMAKARLTEQQRKPMMDCFYLHTRVSSHLGMKTQMAPGIIMELGSYNGSQIHDYREWYMNFGAMTGDLGEKRSPGNPGRSAVISYPLAANDHTYAKLPPACKTPGWVAQQKFKLLNDEEIMKLRAFLIKRGKERRNVH